MAAGASEEEAGNHQVWVRVHLQHAVTFCLAAHTHSATSQVNIANQIYDFIDKHINHLDTDLQQLDSEIEADRKELGLQGDETACEKLGIELPKVGRLWRLRGSNSIQRGAAALHGAATIACVHGDGRAGRALQACAEHPRCLCVFLQGLKAAVLGGGGGQAAAMDKKRKGRKKDAEAIGERRSCCLHAGMCLRGPATCCHTHTCRCMPGS